MKKTYLTLSYDDIVGKYPKVVNSIVSWFCAKQDIVGGLMGMEGDGATADEIKEAMKQVVPMIIQHDPRKLYEFFDEKDIRIFISAYPDDDSIFIYHNSSTNHSLTADSRIDAEERAFMDGFILLEKQLTHGKGTEV